MSYDNALAAVGAENITLGLTCKVISLTDDDGHVVATATDGGQSETFTFGHEWKIGGVNMFNSAHPGVDWVLSEVMVQADTEQSAIMTKHYSDDGTLLTVPGESLSEPLEPGAYPNAKICIIAEKKGEAPIGLKIPINLVVEE